MNEIGYRPAHDQRTVRVSFPSPKRTVKVTAKAREGVDSQLPSERVIQVSIAAYKADLQPPNCDLFAAFRCQILTEDREDIFSRIRLRTLSGTLNPIDEKPSRLVLC